MEELRANARAMLASRLGVTVAAAVEAECVSATACFSDSRNFARSWNNPRFRRAYAGIVRNVATACADDAVQSAHVRADDPEGTARALVRLHAHELPAWRDSVARHEKRMLHAYETRTHAKTTRYRCPKCRDNQCDFYEMQTRSADEGMTMFITCLTCGHRWRMS